MDPLEKLKQEEAELEAQMLGNQTPEEPEVSATEDTGIERTEEEAAADEFMMDTITGESDEPEEQPETYEEPEIPEEPQPQKPKRTNWKKRFTNYKTSTDATIYGLRKELMDLKQQMGWVLGENQRLREAKQEVQGDIFEGAFTQEDEDTFGTEGLDVVKKAAQVAIERQVKPLQEELRSQKQQQVKDYQSRVETERRAQYQEFLSRLETLVPDYASVNKDKGFLQWLSGSEDYSGFPRKELLRRAEANGDVARVADFFLDYQRSQTAVQEQSVPESVKRHVTPVGSGGSGAQPQRQTQKGYVKQSDIDKFYSDVMKGRYEGQQGVIEATERMIEDAGREGRILFGQ